MRSRHLLMALLLFAGVCKLAAQSCMPFSDVVWARDQVRTNVDFLPNASMRACQASATGWPCMPPRPIYTDAACSVAVANSTVQGDLAGNFSFYVSVSAPTSALLQVSAANVAGYQYVKPVAGVTGPAGLGLTVNGTISPNQQVQAVFDSTHVQGQDKPYKDYANIQAAVTAAGSDTFTHPNNILSIDQRQPDYANQCINVRMFGARGDNGVTDNWIPLQNAFNYVNPWNTNGWYSTHTTDPCLWFPSGGYKVSNPLYYEGHVSYGLRLQGKSGFGKGPAGAFIYYAGPTDYAPYLFYLLGGNGIVWDGVDLRTFSDQGWVNGTHTQNDLIVDSTNTVSADTPYNITSCVRGNNTGIVSCTIASHTLVAGQSAVKIAGCTGGDPMMNGTFPVLYSNDSTSFAYFQNGASSTCTGGTATKRKSSPSDQNKFTHSSFGAGKSKTSPVTSIAWNSGTNSGTLTTSSAHWLRPGDIGLYTGGSDSRFTGLWRVIAVTSSTSATLQPATNMAPLGGSYASSGKGSANPQRSNSTGGTFHGGSSGIRFAHLEAVTMQVDLMSLDTVQVTGSNFGDSMICVQWDNSGNVKDFSEHNISIVGCRYDQAGFSSGTMHISGYYGSSPFGDSTLPGIVFGGWGATSKVDGLEVEGTYETRLLVGTGGPSTAQSYIHASFESSLPQDDIGISWAGHLTLQGEYFNYNTSGNFGILLGGPLTRNGSNDQGSSSLELDGAQFRNNLKIWDGGGSNLIFDSSAGVGSMWKTAASGGYYGNKPVNVIIKNSSGWNNSTGLSTTFDPGILVGQLMVRQADGTNTHIADAYSAVLRGSDTDCLLGWRNHADTGQLTLCKNTLDQLTWPGTIAPNTYATAANCAANGTAANPSVVSCSAAPAGSFSCATIASGGTCQVNTTAVTANSEIFVQQRTDTTTGTRLSVTCNTNVLAQPAVTAVSAGTSFTINMGIFSTNPLCYSYSIMN